MTLAIALEAIADRTEQSRDPALAAIDAALEVFRAAGADHYILRAGRSDRRGRIAGG